MERRITFSSIFVGTLLTLIFHSPRVVRAADCEGLCREVLGRGFLAEPHFAIDLSEPRGRSTDGVPGLDVVQVKVRLAPGAIGPWHYHPGPALIVVKSGTFKLTQDEEGCPSEGEFPAGSVLFEKPYHVHRPSNPGSEQTEIYITFVVPPAPTPDQIITEPRACKE